MNNIKKVEDGLRAKISIASFMIFFSAFMIFIYISNYIEGFVYSYLTFIFILRMFLRPNSKSSRTRYLATIVIFSLIIFPVFLSWENLSIKREMCPIPSFSLIPQEQRSQINDLNLNDLEYTENPEDLREVTFNSLISVNLKLSLYTPKNVRFHADLIPLDVLVNGKLRKESQLLEKKHSFSSTRIKGPFSEREIYFNVDLANSLTPVLPGRYLLLIYYTAQERLTVGVQSTFYSYEFDIQKEHVFFKANTAESEGKGSIFSFEYPTSPG
ncbi:hypothetical protein LCGC14_2042680, partial [marine sediment metagenome]